ncbi:hypothetical protein, partial [Endozoicomonas sp. ONNA2]|uniref:hypothetical protein n=1 Tax=Endozoicomonas sp. ONNA2 TaxID=2828741 RepID=UPI002147A9FA
IIRNAEFKMGKLFLDDSLSPELRNWPEIIPTFLSLATPFVLSLSKGVYPASIIVAVIPQDERRPSLKCRNYLRTIPERENNR